MEALETEAAVWAGRRREAGRDEAGWWEAKAKWMLLLEANALVHSVPSSNTADAGTFLAAVGERIGLHDEWGWGAKWPDDVHARACAWVRAFVASTIADAAARSARAIET